MAGKWEPGEIIKKDIPDDQTRALWSWGVLFSELGWKCFCCIEMLYISLSWRELSFSDVHSAFFLSVGLSSETKMTYFGPLERIIKFTFKLEFPLFRSIKICISVFKSIGSTNWLFHSIQVLPSCIFSCSTGIWTNKRWLKRKRQKTGIYSKRKHIFEELWHRKWGRVNIQVEVRIVIIITIDWSTYYVPSTMLSTSSLLIIFSQWLCKVSDAIYSFREGEVRRPPEAHC